ncbi:MAG: chemotaxis protein CheW [Deltaproteobacteria bacterium]
MEADSVFSSDEMQLVTFLLGQENFGVDIMNVQEIIRIPAITVIPQAPSYVEGVTNLRGDILPVIDTRSRFGMEKTERSTSSRVIVIDVRGKKVGLSVDAVSEVLRVESERIEKAPAMVSGLDASNITGMVKVNNGNSLVMILDAPTLCNIGSGEKSEKTGWHGSKETAARQEDRKLEEVQLVSFLLDNEEFALEIENVREIIRYPEVVKVPNMPAYVKGVISLRENLMPIIDLRLKLDTGSDDITDSTRVMVVDVNNTRIGLVVDRVYEVTRIPRDTIFPPPQALNMDSAEKLKGIARIDGGKRIIMLIDPGSIITQEELEDIGSMDTAIDSDFTEEESTFIDSLDEEQMVVFKLNNEQFGVRITQVQEINRLTKITKVPRAPRFVEGVINLRGVVIPLIDLRKRFEIEAKEYNEFTRIIVSDINNKKIGIVVDEVLEVLRIPAIYLEKAPDILLENEAASFMDGIAKLRDRMIMMLNLENILLDKEWQKLAALGENEPVPTKKETAVKEPSVKEKPKLKKQK